MRGVWWKIFAAMGLALSAGAYAAPSGWTIVDLGTLGGPGSFASAISNSGYVVGCADLADGTAHAFIYANGAMRDLGAGSDAAGSSCALAVNDSGAAAGRSSAGTLVIWDGASVVSLGITGDIGGIDTSGVVVGTYRDGTTTTAFRYTNGALQAIAGANSAASDINARGQIAGTADGRAFLFENGTLRDLGTLGGARSSANGLNDLGRVVGMASDSNGQPQPFVFDGTMRALPGPGYSGAVAINNRGQVIGSAEGTHGYLIDREAYTRLDRIPAVIAKGLRRLEPTGINDRGWIVGSATNANGDLRAFLLVPGRFSS